MSKQLEILQKRYWVFYSPAHELGGMVDLVASYQTKPAAIKKAKGAPEWGLVYDSHTGVQKLVEDAESDYDLEP